MLRLRLRLRLRATPLLRRLVDADDAVLRDGYFCYGTAVILPHKL